MIVGFNFTKISVEKKKPVEGKIKINHDLKIERVEQKPLPLKDKKNCLVFDFMFSVHYLPGVGEISFNGNVLYLEDQKKIDNILSQWGKDKRVPPDVSVEVVNAIFAKCNVRALELAQELSLPSHLPMPQITLKEDPSSYIG